MRVVFTDAAGEELREIAHYLESRRAGLGGRFLDQVSRATLLIERFPQGGHPLGAKFRRLGLTRFRYVVIYRLNDDVAEVVAVAHERRHPRYWRSRLKNL